MRPDPLNRVRTKFSTVSTYPCRLYRVGLNGRPPPIVRKMFKYPCIFSILDCTLYILRYDPLNVSVNLLNVSLNLLNVPLHRPSDRTCESLYCILHVLNLLTYLSSGIRRESSSSQCYSHGRHRLNS
jgi:hypothetical protein